MNRFLRYLTPDEIDGWETSPMVGPDSVASEDVRPGNDDMDTA